MAFEVIVKRQIEKLLAPAIKCVDMVSSELGAVVQSCAEGVCYHWTGHRPSNLLRGVSILRCLPPDGEVPSTERRDREDPHHLP